MQNYIETKNLKPNRPTKAGEYEEWLKRSNCQVKKYPSWVVFNFTEHEQKHGFMLEESFCLPAYQVIKQGKPEPYYLRYDLALLYRSFLINFESLKARKVKIELAGFMFMKFDKGSKGLKSNIREIMTATSKGVK